MEKVNVKELFEKYRFAMDNEKRCVLSGWNQDSSVEEYMQEEGYEHGVVLFLENIKGVTDGEYILYWEEDIHEEYEDMDSTKSEFVFKRKDEKLFKCLVCVEFGEYSKYMKEVKEKTKKVKYYE